MAAEAAKRGGSYFPLGNSDANPPPGRATATCFCGAVQLEFPTEGKDLRTTFICNCTDCRKITASMFASNFIVTASSLTHLRGQENLRQFAKSDTIATGNTMTNHFCGICGSLMYRVSSGSPENRILRIGTVDDFNLHEGVLKPRVEQFCKDRVSWFAGGVGVEQKDGNFLIPGKGQTRSKEPSKI